MYSLIALKDLCKHGLAIDRAADLDGARQATAMLVGRDIERMDAAACRRAGMESLSENAVDGFIAPIFYYALLGLPGLVLFKVVSTMDSMVGFKTPRYRYFGWCGARLDDVLNFFARALDVCIDDCGRVFFCRIVRRARPLWLGGSSTRSFQGQILGGAKQPRPARSSGDWLALFGRMGCRLRTCGWVLKTTRKVAGPRIYAACAYLSLLLACLA